jgi:hypothetical protein
MGFCHEPTSEMGHLRVETRRESFYVKGLRDWNQDEGHLFIELEYRDVPALRAALDQAMTDAPPVPAGGQPEGEPEPAEQPCPTCGHEHGARGCRSWLCHKPVTGATDPEESGR